MKNINTVEDFINWLDEIETSLDENPTNTEPADTPEDDVQLVQDLALTLVNNRLLKYTRLDSLPSESETHVLTMLYNIAKDSSDAT